MGISEIDSLRTAIMLSREEQCIDCDCPIDTDTDTYISGKAGYLCVLCEMIEGIS